MNQQYYCLRLWDYSTPSHVSKSKAYFGTLDDIRSLMEALERDERHRVDHAETIAAFRKYEAGNHAVTHNVAYQELLLLEPVEVIGEAVLRLENHRWQHLNTWDCPYHMECSEVETHHLWLSSPEDCLRAIKARFRDLGYRSFNGDVKLLESGFWGHPQMLYMDENALCNRLAVIEKRFKNRKEARKDLAEFRNKKDADFTGFCEDIFGDG